MFLSPDESIFPSVEPNSVCVYSSKFDGNGWKAVESDIGIIFSPGRPPCEIVILILFKFGTFVSENESGFEI